MEVLWDIMSKLQRSERTEKGKNQKTDKNGGRRRKEAL